MAPSTIAHRLNPDDCNNTNTCGYSADLLGVDSVGLPDEGGTDERQRHLLYQRQPGAFHHRLLVLRRPTRAGAGQQTYALQQSSAAQVPTFVKLIQERQIEQRVFFINDLIGDFHKALQSKKRMIKCMPITVIAVITFKFSFKLKCLSLLCVSD